MAYRFIFLLVLLLTSCASPARQSLATPTIDYPDNLNITTAGVYDGYGQTVKCVSITANNVTLRNFIVKDCPSHGIYTNGQNVVIENNVVYNAESDRLNADKTGCSSSGDWGSGIKVHIGGEDIIIRNNTVYDNCGEGIAVTRGVNVLVENNVVRDNFSVNIYIDNSNFVTVRNNNVSCTGVFLRDGRRPTGVAIAEEEYTGWGTQRHDNSVIGNTVNGCFFGVSSWDSELPTGKEIRLLIDGNTITNTTGTINSIKLDEVNEGVVIRNNCVDQRIWVRYTSGVTLVNNVCGIPVTPSLTPTRTPTKTPTVTPSRTPTIIATKTPECFELSIGGKICYVP